MSILDSIFGHQSIGHWNTVGGFEQLHTRSLPQTGCEVCEAEGWIPASKQPAAPMTACQQSPDADADNTQAHLTAAKEDVECAIAHLETACADSRVDESLGEFTLDALRGIRDAIEAEMEAGNAQP